MSEPGSRLDRALGAYLGLALGDALGATVEFMRPSEIRRQYGVHRDIVGGGWLKLARGQVTDDTTMSLALGEALLSGGPAALQRFADGEDHDDALTRAIGNAFVRWWRGKPVDCGNTCRRGIQRFLRDGSVSGPPCDGDAGNGALMRNLPVVLATLDDANTFEQLSLTQAHMTHHHPLSDAATLGLGHLTRALLDGLDHEGLCHAASTWAAQHRDFRYTPYPGRATAYVVDTVQTVLHCVTSHRDFEAAVVVAVNQGDDADTTGSLVGMLAGARCGAAALPRRWLQRLQPATLEAVTDQTCALLTLSSQFSPPPPPTSSPGERHAPL